MNAEEKRLNSLRKISLCNGFSTGLSWRKWGPYLSERQWGTVREDYSEDGNAWDYLTHDQARSRAYRWGEDGIAGISDNMQRICFAIALWNGKDPILKERLFGLNGHEGNHGEDVKELYYYLDNTPTHSYMKYLYKYPQNEFPYSDLVETNRNRTRQDREYEVLDTGIFDNNQYFDIFTEYAKKSEEDIYIKITVYNRFSDTAHLTLMPTLWFRNLWDFGLMSRKPKIRLKEDGLVEIEHENAGKYYFYFETPSRTLFTENETNRERLFGVPNDSPFVKDAFHQAVIHQDFGLLEDREEGTKFSPLYEFDIEGNGKVEIKLRLRKQKLRKGGFFQDFGEVFKERIREADEFFESICGTKDEDEKNIQRQALAGMLWNKQYYYIDIPSWLDGDKMQPPPPKARKKGRNHTWRTLNNEDIISMPDKWEYPWYAAWDSAFHMVTFAMMDPVFAKDQLILFLREWYMHPNGQLPAYEWAFSDVNPPVHAWSCLQVYRMDKEKTGTGDIFFLKRVFQKLLINFTWWINRKDKNNNNIFEGGFLGLDNIGIFDRSGEIPGNGLLEEVDATSWMAMYCLNMLEMAIEIAQYDPSYEDVTTKFFEHFTYIAEALNKYSKNWTGSWDRESGFFYDILDLPNGRYVPLKIRSIVGLTSLFPVLILQKKMLKKLPKFYGRLKWFASYRKYNEEYLVIEDLEDGEDILLSLVPRRRLIKLLNAMLDDKEFLSPAGIRSVSKVHEKPYIVNLEGEDFCFNYEPGESNTVLFGGNSNWRGPVWFPINYLLVRSLDIFSEYYRNDCLVEFPVGSGNNINLDEAAYQISKRLISIFKKDENGNRPVHDGDHRYREDPYFRDLVLFYEYFHGDNARGVGASHQTGWTGLVSILINRVAQYEREHHMRN